MKIFKWILICIVLVILIPVFNIILTVLALLGIIPNQSLSDRSKITYAKSRMRTMATYIEQDQIKSGKYYPGTPYWGPMTPEMIRELGWKPDETIDPFNLDGSKAGWRKYPEKYACDRGAYVTIEGNDYYYYTDAESFYMLISYGPDKDMDLTKENIENFQNNTQLFESLQFDPTNGTGSGGDIFRYNR